MMHKLRVGTAAAAAVLGCFLFTSVARAQPGQPPPPPPPSGGGGGYYGPPPPQSAFFHRRGLAIGFGFGVGGMEAESGPIECLNCDYEPAAFAYDFHVGGMINPRLAILFEIWGSGQQLDADGTMLLMQNLMMVAAQYWLTPQLWIKGGVGAAHLTVSYDDGYEADSESIDDGAGIMGAIGYEVVSGRKFAIDLQLRIGTGTYDGINDQITAGAFSVGFNWF